MTAKGLRAEPAPQREKVAVAQHGAGCAPRLAGYK
jgi:hypothetical protein